MEENIRMFKAYDIRTKVQALGKEARDSLLSAIARYYAEDIRPKAVIVSRDARLGCPSLMEDLVEKLLGTCDCIHTELRKLQRVRLADAEAIRHALAVGYRVIYAVFGLELSQPILQRCDAGPACYLTEEEYSYHESEHNERGDKWQSSHMYFARACIEWDSSVIFCLLRAGGGTGRRASFRY